VEQTPGPLGPPADEQSWARVPAADLLPAARPRRKRRGWAAVVVVVVAAAALGGADAAGAFGPASSAASSNPDATGTATVRRGALTEQTQESGTLGSAGSYSVVVPGSPGSGAGGPLAGSGTQTFTWLPQAGNIIRQGQVLYDINQTPVILLYGSVPAYRDLSEGMTGGDVQELNDDLVTLGYATAAALGPVSGWDYFSSETAYALGKLQSHLGLTVTGGAAAGRGGIPAHRHPGEQAGHRGWCPARPSPPARSC
jgi:Putative peptidoglycan binding domain